MIRLGLTDGTPQQLPASAFPEPADIYICDKCQRDITKHLHPHRSHSWQPLGPTRYTCVCGLRFLTGAMEWEDLGDWERRRRINQTLALGMGFSIIFSVFAAIVYFVLRLLHLPRLALATALVMIAFPFVGFMGQFCVEILLSKWRTYVPKP